MWQLVFHHLQRAGGAAARGFDDVIYEVVREERSQPSLSRDPPRRSAEGQTSLTRPPPAQCSAVKSLTNGSEWPLDARVHECTAATLQLKKKYLNLLVFFQKLLPHMKRLVKLLLQFLWSYSRSAFLSWWART